jgi:hypothetical protein
MKSRRLSLWGLITIAYLAMFLAVVVYEHHLADATGTIWISDSTRPAMHFCDRAFSVLAFPIGLWFATGARDGVSTGDILVGIAGMTLNAIVMGHLIAKMIFLVRPVLKHITRRGIGQRV